MLKDKLNKLVTETNLTKDEIVKLSQEVDLIIVEEMKAMLRGAKNEHL